MDSTPQKRRRWFRFSLRTLMIVVTLAAVASWAYWIGWPWWTNYREQLQFERLAEQLHVGCNPQEASTLLFPVGPGFLSSFQLTDDTAVFWLGRQWKDAAYVVLLVAKRDLHLSGSLSQPCQRVEVYRLAPAPKDYRPHSRLSREYTIFATVDEPPSIAYRSDFVDFISGDRTNNPGIKYELIYSDPPAKDKPH